MLYYYNKLPAIMGKTALLRWHGGARIHLGRCNLCTEQQLWNDVCWFSV